MPEAITALITVITGVLVFVLGQMVINFIFNPVKNLKETIGEIQHASIYYANVFSSMMNKEAKDEASTLFRKLAAQLVSTARVIPFYDQLRYIFGLPSMSDIGKAHHALVGLSNMAHRDMESYVARAFSDLQKTLNLKFVNE